MSFSIKQKECGRNLPRFLHTLRANNCWLFFLRKNLGYSIRLYAKVDLRGRADSAGTSIPSRETASCDEEPRFEVFLADAGAHSHRFLSYQKLFSGN